MTTKGELAEEKYADQLFIYIIKFGKITVLSLPYSPHRLLSGRQGPASVVAGIRFPGCSPWVHVDWGEVPLPL